MKTISVVIPIIQNNEPWRDLVKSLSGLTPVVQIIVVSTEQPPIDLSQLDVLWLVSTKGRAQQMNLAQNHITADFIWFLHADTNFKHLPNFDLCDFDSKTLYFFDLKFSEGSTLMRINEVGLWVRSHLLKMPFGDQGFLISQTLFKEMGGYNENSSFGEDHLFAWAVRKKGYDIQGLHEVLSTSSRKYQQHGWLKTTSKHLWLTAKQALPEWRELRKLQRQDK